jgi:hypothetical protein
MIFIAYSQYITTRGILVIKRDICKSYLLVSLSYDHLSLSFTPDTRKSSKIETPIEGDSASKKVQRNFDYHRSTKRIRIEKGNYVYDEAHVY